MCDTIGTPLHFAAQGGHKEMVELLISKGADINLENNHGQTPLALAKQVRKSEIAKLLVERGAIEAEEEEQ